MQSLDGLSRPQVDQPYELGKVEALRVMRCEYESLAADLRENRTQAVHELAATAKRRRIRDVRERDGDAFE